jgi:hypothetical protein
MAWKDKTPKDKVLSILAFVWMRIVPIILVLVFFVGVCFNLWKVQGLPLLVAIGISIAGAILTLIGLTKLINWV